MCFQEACFDTFDSRKSKNSILKIKKDSAYSNEKLRSQSFSMSTKCSCTYNFFRMFEWFRMSTDFEYPRIFSKKAISLNIRVQMHSKKAIF